MPIYVYEIIRPDGKPGKRFELFQNVSEKALTRHPDTGALVQRVYFAPHLPKNRYEKAVKQLAREDRKDASQKAQKKELPLSRRKR